MSTTTAILSRVRALGWKVEMRHEPGAVVIECEDLRHKRRPHFIRVSGYLDVELAKEKAAVDLAQAIGVKLEE